MTINSYLVKSTVVAALGGLLFGFDTAVIAGTTRALSETYHLSPGSLGVTVAAALWGTILGAMLAGIPGDRYGRRDSLRAMAVLYLISSLGCAFAWSWSALVFFRFIGGLGIGGSSVLGPMYIAEIAPAKMAGAVGRLFPVQCGLRNSSGLPFQLSSGALTVWRSRVAMEAGHRRSAGRVFLPDAVRHTAKSALAGEEEEAGGSTRSAALNRRREF